MILGVEVFLFAYGIYAIVTARFEVWKGKELVGNAARFLGTICLLPYPISSIIGLFIGMFCGAKGIDVKPQNFVFIDPVVLISILVFIYIIGNRLYKIQEVSNDVKSFKKNNALTVGICFAGVFLWIEIVSGRSLGGETITGIFFGGVLGAFIGWKLETFANRLFKK